MKRNIIFAVCICLLLSAIFSGCTDNSSDSGDVTDVYYAVEVDSEGNTQVYDSQGNKIADTNDGDSVEIQDDGAVVVNDEVLETKTAAAETTATSADIEINKADTDGMDFGFDEEDVQVQTTAATTAAQSTAVATTNASSANSAPYKITSGGTYTYSGTITDTMITVDAANADVNIVLNNATIKNSKGPAIYVRKADKVTITLASGTTNTVSDGSSYSVSDSNSTLDAAIFSKSDLTVNGSGTLILSGNYKHGIVSKDDLVISSGTLKVTSKNVGLCGKDCVKINSGNITVKAGSDGIRADNEKDTSKGYVYLYGGTVNITAANDGIQAETVINIENVNLSVTAGGGSSTSLTSSSESYKGLKASSDIYITGGTFNINSKDDCIHSNGTVTISGGTYTLSSGDDGIHADTDLAISGSSTKLSVSKSYEGLEATNIVISGGNVSVTATNDGLNAAGGNNSTTSSARPGQNSFNSSTGKIVISGGTLNIKMSGDGIDSNGSVSVTGGTITVSGANNGDTAILDYETSGTISGGTFVGTGAAGMAQNFSSSSAQGAILVNVGNQSAGTAVKLTDSNGNVLISHTAGQAYSCVIISHPSIVKNGTYTLTAGSYSTTVG